MFTVKHQSSLKSATTYFSEHLSQNDYYSEGNSENKGHWIGSSCGLLGLKSGEVVCEEHFVNLCKNLHPISGKRLTVITRIDRRLFFDFTCSAPKSVSIMAVVMKDKRCVEAHLEASRIALRELELFAATRIRKNGAKDEDRNTSNIVAAEFVHTTSRALDPNFHSHFIVFNDTFDSIENKWKALQAEDMYKACTYATAVYRNELARILLSLGFELTQAKHGFEIKGISDKIIKQYSKRSEVRDRLVAKEEVTKGRKLTNNEISHLIHKSRPEKIKTSNDLEVNKKHLSELGFWEKWKLQNLIPQVKTKIAPSIVDFDVVKDEAIKHLSEKQSVMSLQEILKYGLESHLGHINLPKLKEAILTDPKLIKVKNDFTTREILQEEVDMIEVVRNGQDQAPPLAPFHNLSENLGDDQREALEKLLSSCDSILGLSGLAGTGKTTALAEFRQQIARTGRPTLFCAPTAAAVDLLVKDKFSNAVTLARMLNQKSLPEGSVVVLDEAGLVGTSDMLRLCRMVEESGSRLVLVGDTKQHDPVARGNALSILENHSGLEVGLLSRIRRQKSAAFLEVATLAAAHRTGDAFDKLSQLKAVTEFANLQDLYRKVASDYLEVWNTGKSSLIVAPTWAEINGVTDSVRIALREQGVLQGAEAEFRTFRALDWSGIEKGKCDRYTPGMRLHFVLKSGEFQSGDMAEIIAVEGKQLRLRTNSGSEVLFCPKRAPGSFQVGESRQTSVAAGDKLLLQANQADLINGQLVEVLKVLPEGIQLTDGRMIPQGYECYTHGYAVTSQASQGKTVDEVFLVASTRSFPAVSKKQFYVSVTRCRDRVRVYTDDAEGLREKVESKRGRKSSVDLVIEGKQQTPGEKPKTCDDPEGVVSVISRPRKAAKRTLLVRLMERMAKIFRKECRPAKVPKVKMATTSTPKASETPRVSPVPAVPLPPDSPSTGMKI